MTGLLPPTVCSMTSMTRSRGFFITLTVSVVSCKSCLKSIAVHRYSCFLTYQFSNFDTSRSVWTPLKVPFLTEKGIWYNASLCCNKTAKPLKHIPFRYLFFVFRTVQHRFKMPWFSQLVECTTLKHRNNNNYRLHHKVPLVGINVCFSTVNKDCLLIHHHRLINKLLVTFFPVDMLKAPMQIPLYCFYKYELDTKDAYYHLQSCILVFYHNVMAMIILRS